MSLLEVRNIEKRFGKKQVLRGASFSGEGGAALALVGENGSGKSTLLRVLAGVLRAEGSSFCLEGRELLGDHRALSRLAAYVPQGTPLAGELSAYDNLRLWYDRASLERSLETGVLGELGLGEFLRTRADRLSGGMKKRLVIGCAMARDPRVLFMDEPTAALDLSAKGRVLDYVRRFCGGGGIAVIATHDPEELALCGSCFLLRDGVLRPYAYRGDLRALAEAYRGG
jgi:ABC-2 type transport system ATP-binding protein